MDIRLQRAVDANGIWIREDFRITIGGDLVAGR